MECYGVVQRWRSSQGTEGAVMKKLILPLCCIAVLVMGAAVQTGNFFVSLEETTTPSARDSQGKIWTTSANDLLFQDGAGATHVVHTDSYSSMWFHGAPTTATISTQNLFTQITTFVNEGPEDASSNAVGDAAGDDDITINLAGTYNVAIQASITNDGGGTSEFHIGLEVILNTAKTISGATNADPIVITSTAHGLKSGDGVTQSGVVTNTAANGDFIITRVSADTYSLSDLAHATVAGNGAYGGGGSVTSVMPGGIMMERIVSNISLGRGAANGNCVLAAGDVLECYVANEDGTDNLLIEQIQFGVSRIGD